MGKKPKHLYHIVAPSIWPFAIASTLLYLVLTLVAYLHSYTNNIFYFAIGFVILICFAYGWWRDIVIEATYLGYHTSAVQRSHRIGFILFLISEVMFFFSFFWAFFHLSADPSIYIGCLWPPEGIEPLNPLGVPLLNTYILLFSGATITYTHYSIIAGCIRNTFNGYIATLFLAILFTCLQLLEYKAATFSIADGVYGSTFFMTTGLHGLHVIVGTIFILICAIRTYFHHFTRDHHLGLEFAIWYWHFVDVVWLFVFTFIYYWGSIRPTIDAE
jgi:cytochrome c oxidase subunit 3